MEGGGKTVSDEVTAEHEYATVRLAVWVWEVVVAVLRQKDEFGHINAAADAIEWQLTHGSPEVMALFDAALDTLASSVPAAHLDGAVEPFMREHARRQP